MHNLNKIKNEIEQMHREKIPFEKKKKTNSGVSRKKDNSGYDQISTF